MDNDRIRSNLKQVVDTTWAMWSHPMDAANDAAQQGQRPASAAMNVQVQARTLKAQPRPQQNR